MQAGILRGLPLVTGSEACKYSPLATAENSIQSCQDEPSWSSMDPLLGATIQMQRGKENGSMYSNIRRSCNKKPVNLPPVEPTSLAKAQWHTFTQEAFTQVRHDRTRAVQTAQCVNVTPVNAPLKVFNAQSAGKSDMHPGRCAPKGPSEDSMDSQTHLLAELHQDGPHEACKQEEKLVQFEMTEKQSSESHNQMTSQNNQHRLKNPDQTISTVPRKDSNCSLMSQTKSICSLSSGMSGCSADGGKDIEKYSVLALSSTGSSATLCSPPHSLQASSPSSATTLTGSPLLRASWQRSSRSKELLCYTAVKDPDAIVWTPTQKCTVEWNKEGRLGFKIKEVKGEDGTEIYTMVTNVEKSSPVASSGLQLGSRLLSVNGQPIHVQNTEGTGRIQAIDILKQQSKDEPVILTIQTPKAIRSGRRLLHPGSNSNSRSHCEVRKLSMELKNASDKDALMERLPDLRLVVVGSDAESTARQLVGPDNWENASDGAVAKHCVTVIEKKYGSFNWLPADGNNVMEAVVKTERKRLAGHRQSPARAEVSSTGLDLSQMTDYVVLDVVALKDSPLATYCSQVTMTTHSMYIIQFDGDAFMSHPEVCLGNIQEQLDKIRTYAGGDSPIYLLSTWQQISSPTLQKMEEIGSLLQERFAAVFARQLQYYGNCPCFMLNVNQSMSEYPPSKDATCRAECLDEEEASVAFPVDNHFSPVLFHKQSSVSTSTSTSTSSSLLSSMTSSSTCFSDFAPETCLGVLKEHIATNALEQRFVRTRYPCRFLQHRDTVLGMRRGRQKCVMTSAIKQQCQLEDNTDLMMLLQYLHRQGVILSPMFTPTSVHAPSTTHHTFVALNAEDLIPICQQLLQVPDASQQDPDLRQSWTTLKTKGWLTASLMKNILGEDSDASCLSICLEQMNMIHASSAALSCDQSGDQNNANKPATFLVPYHLPASTEPDSMHQRCKSNTNILFVDFEGHFPHGIFMKTMLQLCEVANLMNGSYLVQSQNSWVFNMGGSYTLYVDADLPRCLIKVTVRCKVGFALHNVLSDIYAAVQRVLPSREKFMLGPKCPLQNECKSKALNPSAPHIIDVNGSHVDGPIWCGDKDIRRYPNVRQWMVPSTREAKRNFFNSAGTVLCGDTAISDLPPDVIQMVCDKMNNFSSRGRDWRGLAHQLGYSYGDTQSFATASTFHYNPCKHLLDDWAESGGSTLRALLDALHHPDLNRKDVICQLTDKWKIT